MKYISFLAFLTMASPMFAQEQYNIQQYDGNSNSSFEESMPVVSDIENASLYSWNSHPALVDWLQSKHTPRSIVKATYTNNLATGPYLHYEGRHNVAGEVLAGGQMKIKKWGTLYGHASYAMTGKQGMYQNYVIRPDDYRPYLVADSASTGKNSYEFYRLSGGFSFTGRGGWHYGISGFYEGITLAMKEQPRHSAYNYWFRIGLDVAKTSPRWVAALKVWPEINKQSISANSSLTPFRYLQYYGFGQWNRRETTSGFSYARQMRILGAGGSVLFSLLPANERGWQATIDASYNYRWMETEETNFKNLFSSRTHHFTHNIAVSKAAGQNVKLHLLVSSQADIRHGKENVYENKQVDTEDYLFDYTLVGKNELYKNTWYSESARLKAVWQATPGHAFSLSAGSAIEGYKEEYSIPRMLSENHATSFMATIGWQMNHKRNHIDWEASAATRTTADNKYEGARTFSTNELSQTIIPWMIRGENRLTLGTTLCIMRDIGRTSVGVKSQFFYVKRTQEATHPSFSYGDNPHYTRFNVGVFCLF